jgi:hypothetical protein
MKFIDDCDSILPIEVNLPFFHSDSKINFDIEQLSIRKRTVELDSTIIYNLVIIGGGLAGVSFAARANQMGISNVALIESNNSLLKNFYERTKKINQKVMRSSYKHHLGPVEQVSLADFARLNYSKLTSGEKVMLARERKGERAIPSLPIFLKHSLHVITANNILNNSYGGKVIKLNKEKQLWSIVTDSKEIIAKNVILATGNIINDSQEIVTADMSVPVFSALKDNPDHYLEKGVNNICVNGSGNTAAHIVYNALTRGKVVHWVLRSDLVYRCADIPNEFWRTEGLLSFQKLPISKRMNLLKDIYHGSAMPEHMHIFRKFIKQKKLHIYENSSIVEVKEKTVMLSNGKFFEVDNIIKSFGLKPTPLPDINIQLKTYNGFPVLNDSSLEWYNGLFVGSSLAALSLGPSAKNIDGMRLAIERIFPNLLNTYHPIKDLKLRNRNRWGTFGPIGKIKEEGMHATQIR